MNQNYGTWYIFNVIVWKEFNIFLLFLCGIKVRVGWDLSKWKKSSKLSRNDEFQPKTWSCQISSIFGYHALNPFNMEHRAKTAVKFGILRVVMMWAQLKLGFYHLKNKSLTHLWRPVTGPPNDLPIVPLSFTRWLYRTVKGENKKLNFRKFWDLGKFGVHLCQGLQPIRSPKDVSSWDPKVLWWHANTGCHPVNTTRDSHSKFEKYQILVCQQRGTPPATPINHYLGVRSWKNGPTLKTPIHFSTFLKPHFWA